MEVESKSTLRSSSASFYSYQSTLVEKFQHEIDSDIASIKSSRQGSTSLARSNFYGVLSASLETIKLSYESIVVQPKLLKLQVKLDQYPEYVPVEIYDELLELQRAGKYSKGTRGRAFQMLVALLKRGKVERVIDIVLQWPDLEIQLLLRELSMLRLSEWNSYHVPSVVNTATDSDFLPLQEYENQELSHSYRALLSAILRDKPTVLHGVLTLDEFLLFQQDVLPDSTLRDGLETSLPLFFATLGSEFDKTRRLNPEKRSWNLPPFADNFVRFLKSSKQGDYAAVVSNAIDFLSVFASDAKPTSFCLAVMSHHQSKKSQIHPALPIVWFAIHLSLQITPAFDLFVKHDIFSVVVSLFSRDHSWPFQSSGKPTTEAFEDLFQAYSMMLGVITNRSMSDRLAHRIQKQYPDRFVTIFSSFITHYKSVMSVCAAGGYVLKENIRVEFFDVLLDCSMNSEYPDALKEEAWAELIRQLSTSESSHKLTEGLLMQLPPSRTVPILTRLLHYGLCAQSPDSSLEPPFPPGFEKFTKNLRSTIARFLRAKPSLLHTLDIGWIFAFQSGFTTIPESALHRSGKCLKIYFNEPSKSLSDKPWCTVHHQTRGIIDYLTADAPKSQVDEVVDIVIEYLWEDKVKVKYDEIAAWATAAPTYLKGRLERESEDNSKRTTLAVIMATYLAYQNPDIARRVLGLPWEKLLSSFGLLVDRHSDSCKTEDESKKKIQGLLFLASIAKHAKHQLISSMTTSLPPSIHWDIDTIVYEISSPLLCLEVSNEGWDDLSPLVNDILPPTMGREARFPSFAEVGRRLDVNPWEYLSDYLANTKTPLEARLSFANEYVKFFAVNPEDMWGPVIEVMNVKQCMRVMSFIVYEYLGCGRSQGCTTSPLVEFWLLQMSHVAHAKNLSPSNPIDRFAIYINQIVVHMSCLEGHWFLGGGIKRFCEELRMGSFDFAQREGDDIRLEGVDAEEVQRETKRRRAKLSVDIEHYLELLKLHAQYED